MECQLQFRVREREREREREVTLNDSGHDYEHTCHVEYESEIR